MTTLVDLADMIEKPEGVHNINTKLFSISFPQLRSIQELALKSTNFDYPSAEYRVTAIILDIANYVFVNSNWVHPPGNQPPGISSKKLPGGLGFDFESCPRAGNSTRAGILWKFKVKRFVRVLVLLVINTGCLKNC